MSVSMVFFVLLVSLFIAINCLQTGLKQQEGILFLLIYSFWLEMWLTVEVLSDLHRALGFFPSTAKVRYSVPHAIKVIVD